VKFSDLTIYIHIYIYIYTHIYNIYIYIYMQYIYIYNMVYPYDFPGHLTKISLGLEIWRFSPASFFFTQLSFPSFHDFPGLPLFAHCWLRPGSFGSSASIDPVIFVVTLWL